MAGILRVYDHSGTLQFTPNSVSAIQAGGICKAGNGFFYTAGARALQQFQLEDFVIRLTKTIRAHPSGTEDGHSVCVGHSPEKYDGERLYETIFFNGIGIGLYIYDISNDALEQANSIVGVNDSNQVGGITTNGYQFYYGVHINAPIDAPRIRMVEVQTSGSVNILKQKTPAVVPTDLAFYGEYLWSLEGGTVKQNIFEHGGLYTVNSWTPSGTKITGIEVDKQNVYVMSES